MIGPWVDPSDNDDQEKCLPAPGAGASEEELGSSQITWMS